MSILDLSSLLVLVEPDGPVAQAAFQYPENATRRRYGRAKDVFADSYDDDASEIDLSSYITGEDTSQTVHLALSFDQNPKDLSKGFVFGSDPETCDVLLASNKFSGVTGNHFSIHVDWQTGNSLITCLTPDDAIGMQIKSGKLWRSYLQNAWVVVEPGTMVNIIIFEDTKLVILNPRREDQGFAYGQNVERYFRECQHSVPAMTNLRLYDPEPTSLLISRGRGLSQTEYFPISISVGEKIVLCEASSHQSWTPDSNLSIIKRFRTTKDSWQRHASNVLPRLRGLHHPNIITLEDIITDRTQYMPVYLREPPETLTDILRQEDLGEIEACHMITQILDGLKFLHANGIVHGGICPGSIRIKSSLRPLIIELSDIGLHTHVEFEDSQEREIYTCQLNRASDIPNPIWDTWSAGVVALKILYPCRFPVRKSLTPFQRQQGNYRIAKQRAWVKSLADEAREIYHSEIPVNMGGKKDAAGFLTRVIQVGAAKRLTAEQCLQDPWIRRWQGPFLDDLMMFPAPDEAFCCANGAGLTRDNFDRGFVHEAPDAEGRHEGAFTQDLPSHNSKGKQPQSTTPAAVISPNHQHGQWPPTPQSNRSTAQIYREPRYYNNVTSSSSSHQGRQRSASPRPKRSANSWDHP